MVAKEALEGPQLPLWLLKRYWILALMLTVGAVWFLVWFRGAFDDQGYAPLQPIAFSHQLHAGDMKMDCAFCHFNAERGKHAGVPPMSVCLGCHGADKGAVRNKSPEIIKLLGIADKGSYADPDGTIHEGGMVHWNRVHKLPDHVYFSHQWHVKAGVACQTCHGAVEEMAVVRQYSNLSMGWCLDCHRKSNYVGGLTFDGQPSTFTVGTANYDVVRHPMRNPADPDVHFTERNVAGNAKPEADHGHVAEPAAAADLADKRASTHSAFIKALQAPENQGLPRWRIADLPATHQKVYESLYREQGGKLDLDDFSKSFMNAPTHCSTCHQ
jgi:Cytochrome c7 and related cytochrome c